MLVPVDHLRLIFWILVIVATALGMIVLSWLLGPRNPNPVKLLPYECGFNPFHDARGRTSLRFYVLAMIFLIFDVEVALLYPWTIVHRKMGLKGFVEIIIFMVIILAGYFYALLRGGLEVERGE